MSASPYVRGGANETYYCHVVGLASEQGKKRNGSAAVVRLTASARAAKDSDSDPERRAAVCMDGYPSPAAVKLANLDLISGKDDSSLRAYSVGVGRGTLLDAQFCVAFVQEGEAPPPPLRSPMSGGAARSRGNLFAVETAIQKGLLASRGSSSTRNASKAAMVIKLTDLNVSRALNRLAVGDSAVQLAPPLNKQLKRLSKAAGFPRSLSDRKVLFKFDPHRVGPDGFDGRKSGLRRFNSVLEGSFHIYPCPYKDYADALEVRYADTTRQAIEKDKGLIVSHDIYLDYGIEEAITYAKNAIALGECGRLSPLVLAEVDPQAFWSAILWLNEFLQTLEDSNNVTEELRNDWKALKSGKEKSSVHLKELIGNSEGDELLGLGPTEKWGLNGNKDQHTRVATDHALASLHLVTKVMASKGVFGVGIKYEIKDFYKGSELDKVIAGLGIHQKLVQAEELKKGSTVSMEESERLYNKAMKAAGLGRDSRFRITNELDVCAHCGKRSKTKLKVCVRCGGSAYCGDECQQADWKMHRGGCSRIMVQMERKRKEMEFAGGPKIQAGPFMPNSLPTGPGIICEVSGKGMAAIYWNPEGMSFVSFPAIEPSTSAFIMEMQAMQSPQEIARESAFQFRTFADLPPLMRFLLTCGPLMDLDVAKSCLHDALVAVGGDLSKLRVPKVGFTALEWAAKKGNLETVKWLCTEERTKGLLSIGCPVGWACYTGRVEVARYLVHAGADSGKTDDILFNRVPPLLVAAQNGKLEAMKFLVEECGQNIRMKDEVHRDILMSIKDSANWREQEDHVESHKWAKKKLRAGKKG